MGYDLLLFCLIFCMGASFRLAEVIFHVTLLALGFLKSKYNSVGESCQASAKALLFRGIFSKEHIGIGALAS